MPKYKFTDDEGKEQEIEMEYTPEQIEELKTKAEESTTKIADLSKSIEEKEVEMEKLREKDNNFGKFRQKTEEEKKEFEEGLKGDMKAVYEEVKDLREERDTEKKKRFDSAKENILKQLAGDNDDLKKSIEVKAEDFVGFKDVQTEKELEEKFRSAFTLIKEERPKPNPLYSGGGAVSGFEDPSDKDPEFTETPRGKEVYENFFGHAPKTKEEIEGKK